MKILVDVWNFSSLRIMQHSEPSRENSNTFFHIKTKNFIFTFPDELSTWNDWLRNLYISFRILFWLSRDYSINKIDVMNYAANTQTRPGLALSANLIVFKCLSCGLGVYFGCCGPQSTSNGGSVFLFPIINTIHTKITIINHFQYECFKTKTMPFNFWSSDHLPQSTMSILATSIRNYMRIDDRCQSVKMLCWWYGNYNLTEPICAPTIHVSMAHCCPRCNELNSMYAPPFDTLSFVCIARQHDGQQLLIYARAWIIISSATKRCLKTKQNKKKQRSSSVDWNKRRKSAWHSTREAFRNRAVCGYHFFLNYRLKCNGILFMFGYWLLRQALCADSHWAIILFNHGSVTSNCQRAQKGRKRLIKCVSILYRFIFKRRRELVSWQICYKSIQNTFSYTCKCTKTTSNWISGWQIDVA